MMPEALYFRTHPSGKFSFISERSATENTVKSSLAPLTSYNDLQTSLLSFFSLLLLLSAKEHLSTFSCFFSPSSHSSFTSSPASRFLARDRPLCRRIRDGTPLLRLLNKRALLYLPVPCLPDTSCFRQLCN